jgi:DNA-binding beta-propeller fold protein YncE
MLHPPQPTTGVSGGRAGRHAPAMLAAVLVALAAVLVVLAPVAGATPRQLAHGRGRPSVPGLAFAPHRAGIAPLAFSNPFGFGSALVGSAPAGKFPAAVAFDPATHTIYVADGFGYSGPLAPGDTVSVIDSRHCNARDVSSCPGPWPTITVGSGTPGDEPSGVAVDVASDTVYVSNLGAGTVSVINGATCNAMVRSGCGQTAMSVPVGDGPVGLFADPENHTVYVPNVGDTAVSMIDSANCNATDPAGCPSTPPPTVDVGANPTSAEADLATHTVYVSTVGAANGWAVFGSDRCNATVQSGCGTQGALVGDPSGPNDAEIDAGDDTLYTANFDNTVSAFDLRHCNAGDLAGCATQTAGVVTPFPDPAFSENTVWIAVDPALHTVYAVYNRDDALVAIDTNVCNGAHLTACTTLDPPTIHTGAMPGGVVLDARSQTLYVADELGDDVSVIDAARCNAQTTLGCWHRPPAVALTAPGGVAVDGIEHTAYVTTASDGVALIDARRCSARHPQGCDAAPALVPAGDTPVAVAVSGPTHTIYVADYGTGAIGAISVLDTRACAAADPAGCTTLHTLIVPGGHPDDLALDSFTGTLYVATVAASGTDVVTVFNAATCNATDARGCGEAPATLAVGDSGDGSSALTIAANPRTDTLYATDLVTNGPGAFTGSTVYVIDTAHCNAIDSSGCQQTPAQITVPAVDSSGSTPVGLAVDPVTDTVYTANLDGGDVGTGTVGVIDGATCNGQTTSGCGQKPPTVPTRFGTEGVALDPRTHEVYANNIEDTSVSVIDGRRCNAQDTRGCWPPPSTLPTGDYPGASLAEVAQSSNSSEPLAIDPESGTLYVQTIEGVSVTPLARR